MRPNSFKFEQTRKRIIAKAVMYRIICIAALVCVMFTITGNLLQVTLVVVIYQLFQIALYYANEKIWEHTKWGIVTRQYAKPQRFKSTVRSVLRTSRRVSGIFNRAQLSIRDFIEEHNLSVPSEASLALNEINKEMHKTIRQIYGNETTSCPVCKRLIKDSAKSCSYCNKSSPAISVNTQRKIPSIQKQRERLLRGIHQ